MSTFNLSILNHYSIILYIILNIILLLCIYFYSLKRIEKKNAFVVLLLALLFPFNITYNQIYYTDGFKGILFLVIITTTYYFFFKNFGDNKTNFQFLILLFLLSLIIRLRSYFIILVLIILTSIITDLAKKKKIKKILISILITGVFTTILFLAIPISANNYFLLEKFEVANIDNLIQNLFLFPRTNSLTLILVIWLLFTNIIYAQIEERTALRKEIVYILVTETIIFSIYLFLFSNNNIMGTGFYLGLLPFLPLNIIYFFIYINKFSAKTRNIILVFFAFFSLVEIINRIRLSDYYKIIIDKLFKF